MTSVVLPSGLSGEIRGLTGRDMRFLTNEKVVRDREVEDYIVSNCWVSTSESGPYDLKGDRPDWTGQVLVGDRYYLLIAAREATYPGREYVVKLQCGQIGCKRRFEWEINIAELLAKRTRRLAPADAEAFRAGNRFVETIPYTNTKFTFQLQTAANARRTQTRIEQKKLGPKREKERVNGMIDVLAGVIVEVEGVEKKMNAIFDFLEDLPMSSLDAILPLIQSHDCGVDSDIDVECPYCGGAMLIALPFDRAFMLPSTAASRAQRAQSRALDEEKEEEEQPRANGAINP
jgi:hypothetical protein